ncbi:hypothetical protein [Natrinema pallidum]|nr:hypothetical protein [Natrinema pallidum]
MTARPLRDLVLIGVAPFVSWVWDDAFYAFGLGSAALLLVGGPVPFR